MNLVLFESHELDAPIPRSDRRAVHVLTVLRRSIGESFDAGIIDGARGKAVITRLDDASIVFSFAATDRLSAAPPVTLIVGLPRPQTARDILRDATSLGVAEIYFVRTEKSERSYAQSTLWSSGEWRRHVIAGAEQAFDPRLPQVRHDETLLECVARLATSTDSTDKRIALDNYEAAIPLSTLSVTPDCRVALAIGSERGWSPNERNQLRHSGFTFAHIGTRILRTETAVVSALTLVRAKLGLM